MKLIASLSLLLLILTCSGCDPNSTSEVINGNLKSLIQGKTMGTSYNIAIIHSSDFKLEKKLLKLEIEDLLISINQKVSTYINNSKINQFNELTSTEWQTVDKDFIFIIQAAQNISKSTNGAYDVTISPLIDLWGFGAENQDKPPTKNQLDYAISNIGYQFLEINPANSSIKKTNPKLRIDLSSIAKGFAVDSISDLLQKQGLNNHLVEIGGELKANGFNQANKKWRIAIEQPDLTINMLENGLEISNLAVATSGNYRNYFVENGVRRSHIINPKTGYPIKHNLASVTVLNESTMLADGYATAILVLGEFEGKKFAETNNLDVLMIIRKKDKFEFWSNSDLLH